MDDRRYADNERGRGDAAERGTGSKSTALGAHPNAPADAEDLVQVCFDAADESINKALGEYQDRLLNWNFGYGRDLGAVAGQLRVWARDLWDRFIPAELNGRQMRMPPLLLVFAWSSPNNLGHYRPGRGEAGLRWEISLNARNVCQRSEVDRAHTLLHELLHLAEDLAGTAPRSGNGYHSGWFRRTAESLGIPCTLYGGALPLRDPSPFMAWARARGLSFEAPDAQQRRSAGGRARRPKRARWDCLCPDESRVPVLVARGSTIQATCTRCGADFRREGF